MISKRQYFAGKPHTEEQSRSACLLLASEAQLYVEYCQETGRRPEDAPVDHDTGTEISGARGGNGDGGFRMPDASTGRTDSAHKQARAVDRFDPGNPYDDWISGFDREGGRRNEKLEKYHLYREHPAATPGWAHITTRAPGSGKRTYFP